MLFEDDNAAPKLDLGALSDAEFEALIDNAIAFDFGVVQPMTGSDGSVYDLPRTEIRYKRRIKRLHRAIDRCKKGSKNRRKAQNRLARFQVKLARRRSDARHKLTTTVAKSHGIVIVEDLRIKNMTASARGTIEEPGSNIAQKASLNTSILDLSPGAIFRDLGYKLGWRGGLLLAVDPRYTSQTCSNPACGHCSAESRRSQAEFVCEKCGLSLNADVNAARNIRARGIALLRALRAESLAVTARNPAATARRTTLSARGPRVAACRGPGVGRPGTQEARRSVSSILNQENPRGRDLKEAAE